MEKIRDWKKNVIIYKTNREYILYLDDDEAKKEFLPDNAVPETCLLSQMNAPFGSFTVQYIAYSEEEKKFALFFPSHEHSYYSHEGFVYEDVSFAYLDEYLYIALKENEKWGLMATNFNTPNYTQFGHYLLVVNFKYLTDDDALKYYQKLALHKVDAPLWPVWEPDYCARSFKEGTSWRLRKPARLKTFDYTLDAIKRREYRIHNEEGNITTVRLNLEKTQENTIFVYYPLDHLLSPVEKLVNKTKVEVCNMDCIDAAKQLLDKYNTKPLVLNMASSTNPGGGVEVGSGAQEENLFRRSDYLCSLYQFKNNSLHYSELGVACNMVHCYPLDKQYGAVYSPNVTIFRGNEKDGYPFLLKPFLLDFVAVAAQNFRNKSQIDWCLNKDGEYLYSDEERELMKYKIRIILRLAHLTNHTHLVLSAFGCGAFMNPAKEVAHLFYEILHEDEFANTFEHIIFAILDDHNSISDINPEGNYKPFKEQFAAFN